MLPIRLVGICTLSGNKSKKKKLTLDLTKFQLLDDICSDNQGKQAVLSRFHHIM